MDAAAGMQYLSQQNIVHRDLALRNLLVAASVTGESRYTIKISGLSTLVLRILIWETDFGMSRIITQEINYYKSDDKAIPVKWCAPEVLQHGRFSSHSGIIPFDDLNE